MYGIAVGKNIDSILVPPRRFMSRTEFTFVLDLVTSRLDAFHFHYTAMSFRKQHTRVPSVGLRDIFMKTQS